MGSSARAVSRTQTAIVAGDQGSLNVSHDVPLPDIDPDMVLIKTVSFAVNPVDVQMTGPSATAGAIAGSGFAGIVVKIGSGGPSPKLFRGDRMRSIVPTIDSLLPRIGAWAEYVGAWADFVLKVPDGMSLDSASTLGVGVSTVGYALFCSLDVPGHPRMPATSPKYVLVHGGSTATGTLAIQMVRQ
jgi:NADPH:quinone reductase-like Zn-dependent oxidoreductase